MLTIVKSRRRAIWVVVAGALLLAGVTTLVGLHFERLANAATSYWQATERTNSGARDWFSVAASHDGTKIAAVDFLGYIYTSADSGATWTTRTTSGQREWTSITSSADGTKLAAVVSNGYIYTSADSGATWTEQSASGARAWRGITSSADGMKITAVAQDELIYSSTDGGSTWQSSGTSQIWSSVDSSADGTRLVASVRDAGGDGKVYVSTDSGATWNIGNSFYSRNWISVGISDDGMTMAALSRDGFVASTPDGDVNSNFWYNDGTWNAIAVSGDGATFAIASDAGYIETTNDAGENWVEQTGGGSKLWRSVVITGNNLNMIAASEVDNIYTGGLYQSPSEPTNLVATGGNGQAQLSWTAPSDTGGTPITDYLVEYSDNGGAEWREYTHGASTAPSMTVLGLKNGSEYMFRVAAANVAGPGNPSQAVSARAIAGPVTITSPKTIQVTTTVDEDSGVAVGAGCSLREAAIAASTAAAYAGCTAGGGNGDTIYLPNGTYLRDENSTDTIQLYNTSLDGQSKVGVIVEDYALGLVGDTAVTVSDLTLTTNNAGGVYVMGSNKSFNNIHANGTSSGNFLLGNPSRPISQTHFQTMTSADHSSFMLDCTQVCTDTEVSNGQFAAQYAVQLDLGDEAIVENSSLTSQYSTGITVGENSTVHNNSLSSTSSGSNMITAQAGSTIDTIEQTNTGGSGSIEIRGQAASVKNIQQTSDGASLYLRVDTTDLQNATLLGTDGTYAYIYNNLDGAVFDTVSVTGVSGVSLYGNASDVTLRDFELEGGSTYAYLQGDDYTLEGWKVTQTNTSSQINVYGASPKLLNVKFDGVALNIGATGQAILEDVEIKETLYTAFYASAIDNLSLKNVSFTNNNGEAMYLNLYNGGHVTIEDVTVFDNGAGIFLSRQDSSSPKVDIRNLTLENIYNNYTGNGSGVFGLNNISESTIDSVHILGSNDENHAEMSIYGGSKHALSNITIENNAGRGIYIDAQSGDVDLNNVSVDGAAREESYSAEGIHIDATHTKANNITVKHTLWQPFYVDNTGTVELTNSYFEDNGEAVRIYGDQNSDVSAIIDNVVIKDTRSTSEYGGLNTQYVDELRLSNLTVSGNRSTHQNSAAIHVYGGSATIENTTIFDNYSGGLLLQADTNPETTATIKNSTIAYNIDDDVDGQGASGISVKGDEFDLGKTIDVELVNSLVFANTGTTNQCATYDTATLTALHSMSDTADCGSGVTVVATIADSVETALAVNSSQAERLGKDGGNGFVGTLALRAGSPATSAGIIAECEPKDARAWQRNLAVGCDLGAFQFAIVTPPTENTGGSGGEGGNSGSSNGGASGSNGSSDTSRGGGTNNSVTGNTESTDPTTPSESTDTPKPISSGGNNADGGDKSPSENTDRPMPDGVIWSILIALILAIIIAILIAIARHRRRAQQS